MDFSMLIQWFSVRLIENEAGNFCVDKKWLDFPE